MLRDCGVFDGANLDILGSFVELGKTVIKGTTVANLHKIQEAKVKISMVKAIIRGLSLENKVVRMWKEMSFIIFTGNGMHKVSVGLRNKVMVVVIAGEIILWMVISLPNHVANPQQHAIDNMREARPQGVPPNELRPPNLYYDHENAMQTFHPSTRLQPANGYIPIQNRLGGPQHFDNREQVPPTNPGLSYSQNVRFMDGVMEPHHDESIPFQMAVGDEQGQWLRHTNAITYEGPALAVTTEAMQGNIQAEKDVEDQGEYSSHEGPNLSDIDRVVRVAKRATREL
jgi:hypothetical protein